MPILLDNDIVLKIAKCSLAKEFLEICVVPEETYVLPTLKYVYRLHSTEQALKRVGGERTLSSLLEFLDCVKELDEQPLPDMLAHFQDIDEIDTGEAVLFAIALSWDQSLVITGDKRALLALSTLSQRIGPVGALSGRLKCLEQTVAEMVLRGHPDEIIRKIQSASVDTVMRICFNSGEQRAAIDCLLHYYNDINNRCNNMLAPFPNS